MSEIRTRINGVLELFGDMEISGFVAQIALGAVKNEIERMLGVVPTVLGPRFDDEGRLLVRCRNCKTRGAMPLKGSGEG